MRVVAAALIALVVGGCGGSDDQAQTEPIFREGDQEVLDQLESAGADLAQPRPVDFFVYFESEADARAAAKGVADVGQTTVAAPGEGIEGWLLSVTRRMVVSADTLGPLQRRLVSIAEQHGGEYDGWETTAEP